MKRNNKIAVSVWLSIILIIFCILYLQLANNPFLRNKMKTYYSNDENYTLLKGEVIDIDIYNNRIVVNITTENHSFNSAYLTEGVEFEFYNDNNTIQTINKGDIIEFHSADMHFYNGHRLPIVSLTIDDKAYLSFDVGKENLLEFVEEHI